MSPIFSLERFDLSFLRGSQEEMDRAAALAQSQPVANEWITHHQGFVLAYSGRLQQARSMSRRAQDLARQAIASRIGRRFICIFYEAPISLQES